jgi:hypothetical protein
MDLLSAGDGGSRSWHSLLWHQWVVAALRAEAAVLAHDPRRSPPPRRSKSAHRSQVGPRPASGNRTPGRPADCAPSGRAAAHRRRSARTTATLRSRARSHRFQPNAERPCCVEAPTTRCIAVVHTNPRQHCPSVSVGAICEAAEPRAAQGRRLEYILRAHEGQRLYGADHAS